MIIGEGCGDSTGVTGIEQAQGILVIHQHCEPECRRKRAAADFLRQANIPPATQVR